MKQLDAYRLSRYESALLDHELASQKFHAGILLLKQDGQRAKERVDELARDLEVKHGHLIECARRLFSIA